MDMDGKEAILAFVEPLQFLIPRCFGEISVEAIGPAVVFAGKNAGMPFFLGHNWKSAVSADIVESIDISIAVLAEYELETSYVIT